VWTPPGDDDSARPDDDDATVANDDDSAVADDDDATTPPPPAVEQSAHGAVVLLRFDGVNAGVLLGAAFAAEPLAPSAEEAALSRVTGLALPTIAPDDGYRQLPSDAYPGPFELETGGLFALLDEVSVALSAAEPGIFAASEVSLDLAPFDQPWTAQFTGPGPFEGFHDAPGPPEPVALTSDRLLGATLFLPAGEGISLDVSPAPTSSEPDVFAVSPPSEPGRAWRGGATVAVPAADLPVSDNGELYFVHQRVARAREDDGTRSLVLSAHTWFVGFVVRLGTDDVFLRPVVAEPGELTPGQVLEFAPEPPLADVTLPYVLSINGSSFPVTVANGRVQVTVDQPQFLGTGWLQVEMPLPGGVGRGAIRIGGPPPSCDVQEFGSNNVLDGANAFAAGQVLCGALDPAGDEDFAVFQATFGATYELQVWNRRIGATGDTRLAILDEDGAVLAENDDAFGTDSGLIWTSDVTGPRFVRISEYSAAGGPGYLWRLVVRPWGSP
jgi:hypothetical protein